MTKTNYRTIENLGGGQKAYKVVDILGDNGFIKIKRGKYNRILLSPKDFEICKDFLDYQKDVDSLPLAVSEYEKEQLESELQTTKKEKDKLQRQNRNLRNKLVLVKRPVHKRFLIKLRNWIDRLI